MDIITPKKIPWLWIAAVVGGVLLVAGIFYLLLRPTTPQQIDNVFGMSDVVDALQGIQTNTDFYNTLSSAEEPEPQQPTPYPSETVRAPLPSKQAPKLEFDQVFEALKNTDDNTNNHIEVFLRQANNAAQVRTFKSLKDFNLKLNPNTQEPIELGYQSEHKDGSYPIDFSRTLTTDRNISAILINEIDSTLAGKVVAQIEDNIYASHGRLILIPAGSKAVGYYQPLEAVGDTRLRIIWSRIITPVGVDIITDAEMADQMGRSGLGGEVDTRFFDRYGLALLISSINALGQMSFSTDSEGQAIFINTYGEDLSNLSAQILEEQINIKPIIRINAGTRILISPTSDIWFKDINGKVIVQAANFNQEATNEIN